MTRRLCIVSALIAFCTMLVGCVDSDTGFSESKKSKAQSRCSEVVVTDGMGRRVSLQVPARRIVSLSPGFTETLFQIGCGEQVILRDKWSDFPPEATQLPVTDSVNPSVEAIAGFRPDLVLLYFNDTRHVRALDKIGVASAVFDPKTFEQVADTIKILGQLCGRSVQADMLAHTMKARKKAVAQKAGALHAVRVYVEIDGTDSSRPWTAGAGSFVNELLESAGAENVFAHLKKPYAQVNIEEVIARNPEVILLAGTESADIRDVRYVINRPGFHAIDAVKQNRIIRSIDKNILSRPSARLADGLEQLFEALHSSKGNH